jgi:hypothetical protein
LAARSLIEEAPFTSLRTWHAAAFCRRNFHRLAVRCALNAVQQRTLNATGTFSAEGWLQIGLAGHQPSLGERYISTGSLYLCSVAFLPLGLDPKDAFWFDAAAPWTQKSIWSGHDAIPDHAMDTRA